MNRYYLLLCLLVLAGGCKEKKAVSPKVFVETSRLEVATDLVSDTIFKEIYIPHNLYSNTGKSKGPHVLREILELDIHFPKRKNWMILEVPYTICVQPGSAGHEVRLAADTLAAKLQPVGSSGIMAPGQDVPKRLLRPDNTAEDYTSLGETRILMNWTNGRSTITGGEDPTVYKAGLSLGDGVDFLWAKRIQNDYYAGVKYRIVKSAGKRIGSDSADYRFSVVSTINASESGILSD